MKLLLIKATILAFPFVLWCFLIALIDPFNRFNITNIINEQTKIKTGNRSPATMPFFNMYWKTISFKSDPNQNVIIGDSRIYGLNDDDIKKVTKQKYFNFGIPGGNCRTMIDTFWFCDKYIKLKNVYFGISFHVYNDAVNYDLFSEADSVIQNPLLYFNNQKVIKETLHLVRQKYRTCHPQSQSQDKKTEEKKDSLTIGETKRWEEIIDRLPYKPYRYPSKYYAELKTIFDYCKRKGVNLVFIIFPSYKDVHEKEIYYGLQKEKSRFKSDIKRLGKVFDFDYPNRITNNKDNYYDPMHLKSEAQKKIIMSIWGNDE